MRILVGMDLASKSVCCCVMNESGKVIERRGIGWEVEEWREALLKYGAENVEVAFETGPEGYRAKAILDDLGIESYPFHAASFPLIGNSKRKTDRIDAEKICRALRGGALPRKVILPCDEVAKLRTLITEWEASVKTMEMWVNRVKGIARQWGVKLPGYSRRRAVEWWREVEEAFPASLRCSVQRVSRMALTALQNLEELGEETAEQVRGAGQSQVAKLLMTIPGIGKHISAALSAYLEDGSRFSSARKFAAYLGLVPTVEQTGEGRPRLGHITKQGPAALRRLLVQAAQTAIRGHQLDRTRWKAWFDRVQRKRGRKIAIVALARKIAEVAYAVVRENTCWDPTRLRPTAS